MFPIELLMFRLLSLGSRGAGADRPNCTIVRKEINAEDTLTCIAVGNPPEVSVLVSVCEWGGVGVRGFDARWANIRLSIQAQRSNHIHYISMCV